MIKGMVKLPVPTVLATALPEIVPKKLEATTEALAAPPRERPVSAKARSR
jgi:hypothetical protein